MRPRPLRKTTGPNSRFGVALIVTAFLASFPQIAHGQDRIAPARSIRVVETTERLNNRKVRIVVDDLTPAEILKIQVQLARKGFDPRVRNGMLDEPTLEALYEFQIERDLQICGCVSYETIVELGIRPQIVASVDYFESTAPPAYSSAVFYAPYGVKRHGLRGKRHGRYGAGVFIGHAPARRGSRYGHERKPKLIRGSDSVAERHIRRAPARRSPPGRTVRPALSSGRSAGVRVGASASVARR